MPELPDQEPLPPLSEEELRRLQTAAELATGGEWAIMLGQSTNGDQMVGTPRMRFPVATFTMNYDARFGVLAQPQTVLRLLFDLAATKQEARLATHHVGVLGDQLGKAEEELAAARAEIERLRETLTFIRDSNWYTVKGLQESAARALVAPADGEEREVPNPGLRGVVDGPGVFCPCRRCLEAAWQKKQDEAVARGETFSPLAFDPCNPNSRMILCPICGNKRCPHATFHENPCSGSNAPGQPGSDYPDLWKDRGEGTKS